MKTRLIYLLIILTFLAPPTYASEVDLPGYAQFTYPDSVILKKSGCQRIGVSYKTYDELPREDTVFLIAITSKKDKRSVGAAAWFSKLTYMGAGALPAMSRIGTLELKVCRKPWRFSSSADKLTPSVKPGTYRIFFVGGRIDPVSGQTMPDKEEIIRFIKFI